MSLLSSVLCVRAVPLHGGDAAARVSWLLGNETQALRGGEAHGSWRL